MKWIASFSLFSLFLLKVQAGENYLNLINHPNSLSLIRKSYSTPAKSVVDDDLCDIDLNLFENALDEKESWAIRFVDTWAKISAGYLSGNSFFVGDFDSCVRFHYQQSLDRQFQGQHCLVVLSALPNSTLNEDRDDLSLKHM